MHEGALLFIILAYMPDPLTDFHLR